MSKGCDNITTQTRQRVGWRLRQTLFIYSTNENSSRTRSVYHPQILYKWFNLRLFQYEQPYFNIVPRYPVNSYTWECHVRRERLPLPRVRLSFSLIYRFISPSSPFTLVGRRIRPTSVHLMRFLLPATPVLPSVRSATSPGSRNQWDLRLTRGAWRDRVSTESQFVKSLYYSLKKKREKEM